jgi:hypothetical protein
MNLKFTRMIAFLIAVVVAAIAMIPLQGCGGSRSIIISKLAQSITFSTAPTLALGGTATVSATASSMLAVTYSSLTTSVCTIDSNSGVVTDLTAGQCTIAANQAGDWNYDAAPQLTQKITVTGSSNLPQTQTITFGTAPTITLGGTATVLATASSGLAVTFSSQITSICTVDGASGLVTDLTAGTCTIAANQAGNSEYAPAAQVTQSIVVTDKSLESQTIAFGTAPTLILGGTGTVSATASSGLDVTYSSKTSSICIVDSESGRVTDLAAGTCIIAADQAGNGSYNAAYEVTQSIVVTDAGGTTYKVILTFYEDETIPNNSIFTGVFTYDPTTQTPSNLYGSLTESMTQETSVTTSEMTAVALSYQLSSVSDGDGGKLVSSFHLDNTNVFEGGGFTTGNTIYYGYPKDKRPDQGGTGNAYITIDVNLTDPAESSLTTTLLDRLVYGDCTNLGMMGRVCMTGQAQVSPYVGSMGGVPFSQVTTLDGSAAQTVSFGAAPTLLVSTSSTEIAGTVKATVTSGLAVTYSSLTPVICSVYQDTGDIQVTGFSSATAGAVCTIAADQYGNSTYAPASRATQNITLQ